MADIECVTNFLLTSWDIQAVVCIHETRPTWRIIPFFCQMWVHIPVPWIRCLFYFYHSNDSWKAPVPFTTWMSMEVIVTIVSKLAYNLLKGLTIYLYRGYNIYNPVTKYHGHPSRDPCNAFLSSLYIWVVSLISSF